MSLPVISQVTIVGCFQFLEKLEVQLDENPLEYGPARLNKKTARTRKMLASTEKLYNRVSQWLQKYKMAHRTADIDLDLAKKALFANDPETRAGRNQTTQDAIASVKLNDQVREVARLESVIEDLVALMTVVKAKRADLKDTQARIRDQIKLCQEELGLGGHWGSKVPPEDGSSPSEENIDKITVTELADIFQGVRVEGAPLAPEPEPERVEEETSESDAQIESILKEAAQEVEQDLSDILPTPEESEDPEPEPVSEEEEEAPLEAAEPEEPGLTDYPQIGYCEICGEPQYDAPSGPVCVNGHGGAGTVDHPDDALNAPGRNDITEPGTEEPLRELEEGQGTSSDGEADDLLSSLGVESKPKERKEVDVDSIMSDFGL